jgi:hypothetical protein
MCIACEDMELFYAYLDSVEQAKKEAELKAQPWEGEVTQFPQEGDTPAPAKPATGSKPGFVCDEPE